MEGQAWDDGAGSLEEKTISKQFFCAKMVFEV